MSGMRVDTTKGGWTGETLDLSRAVVGFSKQARGEMRDFLAGHRNAGRMEDIAVRRSDLPYLAAGVDGWLGEIESGIRFVVIQPDEGSSPRELQVRHWVLSNLFGEPLVQNSEGDRQVRVWDRDPTRRMADGARYHQTREGGDAHTDNVNIPELWDYLVFGCTVPAAVGGWNVIVSGLAVHDYLVNNIPEAVDVLSGDYWWEYRGIKDDTYQAPVLTYDANGEPHFRYLRTYLEAAHQKVGEPMSDRQMWAINVLDAVIELPELRFTRRLRAGEILVTRDSQIFHARTNFADSLDALPVDGQTKGADALIQRTMERTWVQKRPA
jgi:hypothetical protein